MVSHSVLFFGWMISFELLIMLVYRASLKHVKLVSI